ncbi:MAG: hypothetical protein GWP08_09215 [Nitrospiraceae bacterium]|nr:hypothetical protein [Nitrospiraceae bacterium]
MPGQCELVFKLANLEAGAEKEDRLRFLKRNVDERFCHVEREDVASLQRGLSTMVIERPTCLLLFIHISRWPSLGSDMQQWNGDLKRVCCVVVFGGEGIAGRQAKALQEAASEANMAGRVRVYLDEFPPRNSTARAKLRQLVKCFERGALQTAPDWTEFSKLSLQVETEPTAETPLGILGFLIAGYVEARRPKSDGKGPDSGVFAAPARESVGQEALVATAFADAETQRLFRPREMLHHGIPVKLESVDDWGWFWFDECLPAAEEWSWSRLQEMLPDLAGASAMKSLWELIRAEWFGQPKDLRMREVCRDWGQPEMDTLIQKAYDEYGAFYKEHWGPALADQLERRRNALSHGLLKNAFLHGLNAGRSDRTVEQRGEWILAAWAWLSGESPQSQSSSHGVVSVMGALRTWPALRCALRRLFGEIPGEYGFCLTPEGEGARKALFEGEQAPVEVAARFVREFRSRPLASRDEKLMLLEEFLDAVDGISLLLRRMRLVDNPEGAFGGLFASMSCWSGSVM